MSVTKGLFDGEDFVKAFLAISSLILLFVFIGVCLETITHTIKSSTNHYNRANVVTKLIETNTMVGVFAAEGELFWLSKEDWVKTPIYVGDTVTYRLTYIWMQRPNVTILEVKRK